MKKFVIPLVSLIIIVLAVIVINPPRMIVGGLRGGPIASNETAYLEEYKCFGVPYNFCPPWPDYGCDVYCYGIIHSKTCYIDSLETKTPTDCR